jgi:hypothetical protein
MVTKSNPEETATVWVFPGITELADEALAEAVLTTDNRYTMTDCINKGLQLHGMVADAKQRGGGFVILTPSTTALVDKPYDAQSAVTTSIKVNLTQKSLMALLNNAQFDPQYLNSHSEVLNQAVQRWRDVVVAYQKNWLVLLKESSEAPWEVLRVS